MISIRFQEEQEFISNFLKTNNIANDVWIGLKYTSNQLKLVWGCIIPNRLEMVKNIRIKGSICGLNEVKGLREVGCTYFNSLAVN